MSKLTFRAKALEHSRKMAIYIGDEIPELTDFAIVNRTVPEMPSGMEKEEETQHHLQKALSAQQSRGSITNLIIPTPEMRGSDHYERIYSTRAGFTASKKFVHVQPTTTDQELPDYDMDTEDELWLAKHKSIYDDLDCDPVRFESMLDQLEKGSGHVVVKLNEARALIKEKEDVVITVYDYWLNKRLRQEKTIKEVLASKLEDHPVPPQTPSSTVNPYLAFRKRAEKMQTRKNRKNDEQSYLGILQLKKSFEKAKHLLKLLKLRETNKKELVETKKLIFEKRHELKDWTGKLVRESEECVGPIRLPDWSHLFSHQTIADDEDNNLSQECHASANRDRKKHDATGAGARYHDNEEGEKPRKRRKKHHRKHPSIRLHGVEVASEDADDDLEVDDVKVRGDDDDDEEVERLSRSVSFFGTHDVWRSFESDVTTSDDSECENLPDGRYTFKRREGCSYEAPIPFQTASDEGNLSDNRVLSSDFRFWAGRTFSQTTLVEPPVSGLLRRRVGRGGRVVIDRMSSSSSPWDEVGTPSSCGLKRKRKLTSRCDDAPGGIHASRRLKDEDDGSALPSRSIDIRNEKVDGNPDNDSTRNDKKHTTPLLVVGASDLRLEESHRPFLIDPTSCTRRDDGALSVASSSSSSLDRTTVRMSRVSFLLGSTFPTGYKRNCSNRTDSEDSGVCSPSPTPSAGSFPGGISSSDRHLDHPKNKAPLPNSVSNNLKNRISPTAETDDGISDDHSMNGDSCSSFSDHRVKINSDGSSDLVNYSNEPPVANLCSTLTNMEDRKAKIISNGNCLVRKHLSTFDNGKFSIASSKTIKDGTPKMVQTQVGSEISSLNGEGIRLQYQMKLADINNLISMNGEVATALEVS